MRFVAFLRAINTGNRRIKMMELRDVFSYAGFEHVETYIASGNVIFEAGSPPDVGRIEKAIRDGVGFDSRAFVRSASEVRSVLERVPWKHAGAVVDVSFLEQSPEDRLARDLEATAVLPEELAVRGAEVYFLRASRGGQTTHKEQVVAKTLHMNTTRRGLRTVDQIHRRFLT